MLNESLNYECVEDYLQNTPHLPLPNLVTGLTGLSLNASQAWNTARGIHSNWVRVDRHRPTINRLHANRLEMDFQFIKMQIYLLD